MSLERDVTVTNHAARGGGRVNLYFYLFWLIDLLFIMFVPLTKEEWVIITYVCVCMCACIFVDILLHPHNHNVMYIWRLR